MNWRVFYAVMMWTLGFWEWGADYTIVKNRHVGLDIGTGSRAVNVPAIQAGRVAVVLKTVSMGYVIVLDTGLGGVWRYHAYCHMSGDNLPWVGKWIDRNERVGRLAAGPRGLPMTDVEYGGTAWTGIHLHMVMTDKIDGAYRLNTGARFGNPEDFIRDALAGTPAGGGATPFPEPKEEWDEMATEQQVEDAAYRAANRAVRDVLGTKADVMAQMRAEVRAELDAFFQKREATGVAALDIVAPDGGHHYCILSTKSFRHLVRTDNPERIRNMLTESDRWVETTTDELRKLLRTFGCDTDVFRLEKNPKGGTQLLTVLDPLDTTESERGTFKQGAVWTAENVIRAQLAAEKS